MFLWDLLNSKREPLTELSDARTDTQVQIWNFFFPSYELNSSVGGERKGNFLFKCSTWFITPAFPPAETSETDEFDNNKINCTECAMEIMIPVVWKKGMVYGIMIPGCKHLSEKEKNKQTNNKTQNQTSRSCNQKKNNLVVSHDINQSTF